jgi:hypothetical protein
MASNDTTYVTKTTAITSSAMQALNDKVWKGRDPAYATTTGTGTAYVLTLPSPSLYNVYTTGDNFKVKIHTANTGAATLSIVGSTTLAVKAIVNANGTALSAGQLAAGQIVDLVYDGTNFQAINLTTTVGSLTASSVTFTQQGTGAVATTIQVREQEWMSLWDFLTTAQITDATSGSPSLDLTTAINTATAAAVAAKKALYWPAGTYIASQITVLAGMKWIGESVKYVTLKMKNSTNPAEGSGALLWSPSLDCDDVFIQSMTFDGNSANNTVGDTLVIKGCRTRLIDVCVNNAASNAVITNFNPASAARVDGIEGLFSNITIDTPQKSGWVHYGPNDSSFENIIIIDPGVKTTNSFYGMYLDATSGNGRFNNIHVWNRSTTTNVAVAGVQVNSSGNNFVNCHFEGSNLPLNISGSFNNFAACTYYATRGTYCVYLATPGSGNVITGTAWHYAGFPAYTGILLSSTSNVINITVAGDSFTPIAFNDSATGGNNVTVTGYLTAGGALYSGTYSSTDIIDIQVTGAGGGILTQGIGNTNFLAYQSSVQTLTASAWNTITYPNVVFDTNGEYNSSTSVFTAKTKGYYNFQASMFFVNTGAQDRGIGLYVNGSLSKTLQWVGSPATGKFLLNAHSGPISLNVGDTVNAVYYVGSADTSAPGAQYVYFSGSRIK